MSEVKATVGVLTQGCKVNQYESRAIEEALEALGYVICAPEARCDAYIINTCTVTAESDRKARQLIRRVRAQNPAAFIVVTGCFAQTDPEGAALEGRDRQYEQNAKCQGAGCAVCPGREKSKCLYRRSLHRKRALL